MSSSNGIHHIPLNGKAPEPHEPLWLTLTFLIGFVMFLVGAIGLFYDWFGMWGAVCSGGFLALFCVAYRREARKRRK